MPITPLGNDSGASVAADLLERLGNQLGNELIHAPNTAPSPAPNTAPSPAPNTAPSPAPDTVSTGVSHAPLELVTYTHPLAAPVNSTLAIATPLIATQVLARLGNYLGGIVGRPSSSLPPAGLPPAGLPPAGLPPAGLPPASSPEQTVNNSPVALMSASINSTPPLPLLAPDLLQHLNNDLAKDISPAGARQLAAKTLPEVPSAHPNQPDAVAPNSAEPATAAGAQGVNGVPPSVLESNLNSRPPAALVPLADSAAVLLSEVATSDISKLASILNPPPDPISNRILDNLLVRAVQEVLNGNVERAVGYLADYATRDPRRAEALPLDPALAPVRDKIDSMVNRMTIVARISAEDGLSRAEQTASESAGRLSDWETHADVLIKLAQRFFDAGGYANYSRTSDLARAVRESAAIPAHAGHALAATASASGSAAGQIVPGVNVPFWVAPESPVINGTRQSPLITKRRYLSTPLDDVFDNLADVTQIFTGALRLLWRRAPLLLLLLTWFGLGFGGGIVIALATRIWPDGAIASFGGFFFDLWGIGFLALVGFGFYMRIRSQK